MPNACAAPEREVRPPAAQESKRKALRNRGGQHAADHRMELHNAHNAEAWRGRCPALCRLTDHPPSYRFFDTPGGNVYLFIEVA
jgi:hypothetical protein